MRWLGRWPFLAGAVLAFAGAVLLLTESQDGREVGAAALLVAGSVMLGAFVVLMARSEDN
jgi:drug/metabolite transporter (DMT)-like permease